MAPAAPDADGGTAPWTTTQAAALAKLLALSQDSGPDVGFPDGAPLARDRAAALAAGDGAGNGGGTGGLGHCPWSPSQSATAGSPSAAWPSSPRSRHGWATWSRGFSRTSSTRSTKAWSRGPRPFFTC